MALHRAYVAFCPRPVPAGARRRRLGALSRVARTLIVGGCVAVATLRSGAADPAWGDWPAWGDAGDGTYRNPVLPADYSDVDCIRVGRDYYAISSTFQYSPGVVVLRSNDLVNWTIVGHVVQDLRAIGPELNWDRMSRYGRGIWAGAIRHHAGKFWVYFGTPDEGYFMSNATDAAGPWTPLRRVLGGPGWDDCCPFWDDDGQGYLVGTHFADGYKTWLWRLTTDGGAVVPESAVLLNQGERREANKLYKIDGVYYHLFSEWRQGVGRYVMMQRSQHIAGPYTEKRQLSGAQRAVMEPNQGGLVQTERGDWYFLTHHGTGAWEGRCLSLLPVTWVDGWPLLGAVGADALGTFVWRGRKPVPSTAVVRPQTGDDFAAPRLGPQWEWNYQPRDERWSLRERPGYLRLRAFKPLRPDDLKAVGNVLTQRAFRTTRNVATAVFELNGLVEGQIAGLGHFAKDSSSLSVRRDGGKFVLEFTHDRSVTAGPALAATRVWLRSSWGLDGVSRYAYSVDGRKFEEFGAPYRLTWGSYRGDRLALFTFSTGAEDGYVDIDEFVYTIE